MSNLEGRSCSTGDMAYAALLRADSATRTRVGSGVEAHASTAGSAASGDLGFSTGPWVAAAADGRAYGHFLSIWQRDAACNWQTTLEARVFHGATTRVEAALSAENAALAAGAAPPSKLIAANAVAQAVADFQATAIEDGFGGALRTFARNYDFEYLTDDALPMNLDLANVYLDHHTARGDWRESARAQSFDSTFLYTAGALADSNHHASRSYVQVWQFDPKVVNWGLRIFLLGRAV